MRTRIEATQLKKDSAVAAQASYISLMGLNFRQDSAATIPNALFFAGGDPAMEGIGAANLVELQDLLLSEGGLVDGKFIHAAPEVCSWVPLVGTGPVADLGLVNGEIVPVAKLVLDDLASVDVVANTLIVLVEDGDQVRPLP